VPLAAAGAAPIADRPQTLTAARSDIPLRTDMRLMDVQPFAFGAFPI
jgi:hypothetical protein